MNIRDAIFVVIDTETTGLDPAKDKLVEIAAVATTAERVVGMWATLVDPGIPIPPETMGIHGITDAMVKGQPSAEDASAFLFEFANIVTQDGRGLHYVAHNAAFDGGFVSTLQPWLCTKRLSQQVWPDAPNHRNQTLRYWRDLKFDDYGIQAHRALGDAIVTAALMRDIIREAQSDSWFSPAITISTVADLQALSDAPIRYKTWWFGKSYSEPIIGTDPGYIRWALKSVEMDADKRFSLEEALRAGTV